MGLPVLFLRNRKWKRGEIHELVRVAEGVKSEICNVKSRDQAGWLLWKFLGEIMWCVTPWCSR